MEGYLYVYEKSGYTYNGGLKMKLIYMSETQIKNMKRNILREMEITYIKEDYYFMKGEITILNYFLEHGISE